MSQNKDRDFYTISEAARVLDVSQATVWRWIAARRLPAYRVGPRRIRIKRQDLEIVFRPVHARESAMPEEKEVEDIWAKYDPKRVREALRRSAGALAGVDVKAVVADLRAARGQKSTGRSE